MGGAASGEVPERLDKELFLARFSTVYMEGLFNKLQNDGMVRRDQVVKMMRDVGYRIPLTEGVCEYTLEGHTSSVKMIIQLSNGKLASGSEDNKIKIWDVSVGLCEATLDCASTMDENQLWTGNHRYGVFRLLELADRRLASGSIDCTEIWNLRTQDRDISIDEGSSAMLMQLKSGQLLTASVDMEIKLWDPMLGGQPRALDKHHKLWAVMTLEMEDGRLISVAGIDANRIEVWNPIIQAQSKGYDFPGSSFSRMIPLHDGRVALADGNTVKVFNVSAGNIDQMLVCENEVKGLAEINGHRIATGDGDRIKIWNVTLGTCEVDVLGFGEVYHLIALSSLLLASVSKDNVVRLWNQATGLCEKSLVGHQDTVTSLVELNDGRLATASKDGTIKIWA